MPTSDTWRLMLRLFLLLASVGLFLASSLPAFAGGTIAGKVIYTGPPEEREFLFAKLPNARFCPKIAQKKPGLVKGDKRIFKTIEVGPDGGLKAAVVAVTDIEDKAFIDEYTGTDSVAELCEFVPYTGVVVPQKSFRVVNVDADPDDPKSAKGVLHNPHTFEILGSNSTTIFNVGLAEKGSKLNKPVVLRKVKQGSIFRLQCDQHEFMQSFFLPVMNPYYAIVKDDGTFEIREVPAGQHRLVAWHPFAGRVEVEVEVLEGRVAQVALVIKKK